MIGTNQQDQMMESALSMAAQIANKSPVAVQGTKDNLNFSRWINLRWEVLMDLYTEVLELDSYLIFVTGATGDARVNFFGRCKFLQI